MDARESSENIALSMGGLEQAAAEVGIAPERLREAARDVELRSDAVLTEKGGSKVGVFNWPQKLEVTRSVGGEISRDSYVDLVDEMRTALGTTGHISTLGNSLSWSASSWQSGNSKPVPIEVCRHSALDSKNRI